MPIERIEVNKKPDETNINLVRRFSKRMKESRNIPKAKSTMHNEKPKSKLERKQSALRRIKKRKEVERLRKLGKIK